MSTPSKRPLAEHLSPPVNEARLARQWRAISARAPVASATHRRAWPLVVSFAALFAAVMVVAVGMRSHRPEERTASGTPSSDNGAREVLTLPDGSRVTLDAGSRIALTSVAPERIHVVLESGGIDLDIPRAESRAFVVTAVNHQITVLGTAFRVRIEAAAEREVLHVDVSRGTVRVARSDGSSPRVLSAGETWSTIVDIAAAQGGPKAASMDSAERIEAPSEPPSPAPQPRAIAPAIAASEGPKELLARATEVRAQGRSREAAALLDQLRKRYRSDARAGLAAFELGRIRLDALGEAASALEAFDDAIAIAPAAPFREDVEARRVDALDALGDSRCGVARTSYLERYPKGVHARTIRLRCPPR